MKCRAGHEHGSIVAAAACDKNPEPKRCDENAGGCGRSAQEGAAFRGGSALCESCKEAIGEAEADDAAKLVAAKALVAKDRAARRQSVRDWKGQLQPAGVIRANQLADAFHEVGKANHYMVGVTIEFNREELEAAEQLLIDRQNAGPQKGKSFQALEHALDAIEHERFVRFVMAERAKPGPRLSRCECCNGDVPHDGAAVHKRPRRRCTRTASVQLRKAADVTIMGKPIPAGPWGSYCDLCAQAIKKYQGDIVERRKEEA